MEKSCYGPIAQNPDAHNTDYVHSSYWFIETNYFKCQNRTEDKCYMKQTAFLWVRAFGHFYLTLPLASDDLIEPIGKKL